MAELDSNANNNEKTADSGHLAYVRATDCKDGTARVQLDQRLPWQDVLELLRALPLDDAMPS
jgi:hypothetical protein